MIIANDEIIKDMLPIQNDVPNCFVCGQQNPHGLKLRFFKESKTSLYTEFTPPDYWTGWGNMLHGGFHGLLLDEVMSWAVWGLLDIKAFVTKEMTVRYLRPIYVGQPLKISGYLEKNDGKDITMRGEIRDKDGNVLTEAKGIIRSVNPERIRNMNGVV